MYVFHDTKRFTSNSAFFQFTPLNKKNEKKADESALP